MEPPHCVVAREVVNTFGAREIHDGEASIKVRDGAAAMQALSVVMPERRRAR